MSIYEAFRAVKHEFKELKDNYTDVSLLTIVELRSLPAVNNHLLEEEVPRADTGDGNVTQRSAILTFLDISIYSFYSSLCQN
jgi:hypothetical protein